MNAEPIPLRAGPLSLWWQPEDGMLRHVCAGGRELLRGVTASVRDRHWRTLSAPARNVRIERGETSFRLSFLVAFETDGIGYEWRGEITGTPDGVVVYRFEGAARTTFESSRIGLCVLHPAEAAGARVEIEHVDGTTMRTRMPTKISPHQPFFNLRAMTVETAPELLLQVRMEGDVFEMEDHRNWLDASFKTYCAPLGRPHPVVVRAGGRVSQAVILRLLDSERVPSVLMSAMPESPRPCGSGKKRPRLGLAWPSDDTCELTMEERVLLDALRLSHLRIEIEPDNPRRMRAAEAGLREARRAGLPVEIALHLDEANAPEAEAWVRGCGENVARWIVIERGRTAVTSARWPEAVRAWSDARAPVVAGSDVQFTQLNRERPPERGLDGVAFGFNPQVHASDVRSILETLSIIPLVVTQARSFVGGAPVHVGVITFCPAGRTASGEDPRLASELGERWTRGAIDALAAADAESATFYTVRGVLGAPQVAAVFAEPKNLP